MQYLRLLHSSLGPNPNLLTWAQVAMNCQAHISQLTKYNIRRISPTDPILQSQKRIPKPSNVAASKKIENRGRRF